MQPTKNVLHLMISSHFIFKTYGDESNKFNSKVKIKTHISQNISLHFEN